jgi:hypothetical protein
LERVEDARPGEQIAVLVAELLVPLARQVLGLGRLVLEDDVERHVSMSLTLTGSSTFLSSTIVPTGDGNEGGSFRIHGPLGSVASVGRPTTPTRAGRLADASVDHTEARCAE